MAKRDGSKVEMEAVCSDPGGAEGPVPVGDDSGNL